MERDTYNVSFSFLWQAVLLYHVRFACQRCNLISQREHCAQSIWSTWPSLYYIRWLIWTLPIYFQLVWPRNKTPSLREPLFFTMRSGLIMFIVAILIATDVLGASKGLLAGFECDQEGPGLECDRPGCEEYFTDRPLHMKNHHDEGLLFLSLSLGNNSPRLGGWLTVAFFLRPVLFWY